MSYQRANYIFVVNEQPLLRWLNKDQLSSLTRTKWALIVYVIHSLSFDSIITWITICHSLPTFPVVASFNKREKITQNSQFLHGRIISSRTIHIYYINNISVITIIIKKHFCDRPFTLWNVCKNVNSVVLWFKQK